MKKIICIFLILFFVGCNKNYDEKDTAVLEIEAKDTLYEISHIHDDEKCVPTKLMLYKDGRYEVYTKYIKKIDETDFLPPYYMYTKSNKGKYDFDLSNITSGLEITGDIYEDVKYTIWDYDSGITYQIKYGETNKILDGLLKNIDVDLDMCLEEDK